MEHYIVQRAVQLAQRGDRAAAYRLLSQLVRRNPQCAAAWLWLSGVVDSPLRQRECLERVLRLEPACAAAKTGLEQLRRNAERSVVIDRGPAPWRIGEYLVEYGFLTPQQRAEAAAEHMRYAGSKMFGTILLERGWITPHGLATMLMLQQHEQLLGPHARPPMRLGEYLLAAGHLSVEQLATLLAQQMIHAQQGRYEALGELIIRGHYLDASVVQQALAKQWFQQHRRAA